MCRCRGQIKTHERGEETRSIATASYGGRPLCLLCRHLPTPWGVIKGSKTTMFLRDSRPYDKKTPLHYSLLLITLPQTPRPYRTMYLSGTYFFTLTSYLLPCRRHPAPTVITALRKNSGLIFPPIYMRAPARARYCCSLNVFIVLLYNVMFACQFPCQFFALCVSIPCHLSCQFTLSRGHKKAP